MLRAGRFPPPPALGASGRISGPPEVEQPLPAPIDLDQTRQLQTLPRPGTSVEKVVGDLVELKSELGSQPADHNQAARPGGWIEQVKVLFPHVDYARS
jgi:hypothetical protein